MVSCLFGVLPRQMHLHVLLKDHDSSCARIAVTVRTEAGQIKFALGQCVISACYSLCCNIKLLTFQLVENGRSIGCMPNYQWLPVR